MKKIILLIFILAIAINITGAFALEVVNLTEGKTAYVNVSDRELNVIIFPTNVKVLTKSAVLEVQNDDKRVFVSFRPDAETGAITESPEQLYFLTENRTYSLALVPKKIPAETIIAKIDEGLNEKALKWEKENPFVATVKELMKSMYKSIPPNGYEVAYQEDNESETQINGISKILNIKYVGATLTGEVYKVPNTSIGNIRLKEQLFFEKGVVAVSIDSHELGSAEKTEVYVVRRLDISESQEGAFEVLLN